MTRVLNLFTLFGAAKSMIHQVDTFFRHRAACQSILETVTSQTHVTASICSAPKSSASRFLHLQGSRSSLSNEYKCSKQSIPTPPITVRVPMHLEVPSQIPRKDPKSDKLKAALNSLGQDSVQAVYDPLEI